MPCRLVFSALLSLSLLGAALGSDAQALPTLKSPDIRYGPLTPAQMHEDLAVLQRALTEIHPGLYRYNTPAEISARFAAIQANAAKPASEAEFFRSLAQLVSTIRCGHTYLNPYNQRDSLMASLFGQRTYLPIYFSVVNHRFIVTQNLSSQPLAPGSEIKRINGVPVSRIIATLLTVTTADGNGTQNYRLNSIGLASDDKYPLFDLYFPLFFPLSSPEFQVDAIDSVTGKSVSLRVPAMTKPERMAALAARGGALSESGWRFSTLNPETACLKLGSFVTFHAKQDYKVFLADAFAQMREKHTKYLIVDLRGNSGGDEDMGAAVASYLADRPIPCYDKKVRFVRTVKIDDALFRCLDTYDDTLSRRVQVSLAPTHFKASANGLYEPLDRPACAPLLPAADHFQGKVYVLEDASNASAAFQFLRAVQDNKLATLVGQESGGNKQGINGDSFFFLSLPNSHIEVDIPVFYEAPPTPQPDEGIKPDVVVPVSIPDIIKHIDTDMDVVMHLIAQSRTTQFPQAMPSQSAARADTSANLGRVPKSPLNPPP